MRLASDFSENGKQPSLSSPSLHVGWSLSADMGRLINAMQEKMKKNKEVHTDLQVCVVCPC